MKGIIHIIILLSLIGCSSNKPYDEDFVKEWDMSSSLYHSDSIELAEIGMRRIESTLLEIDGNPKLFGTKRKDDYLIKTRLRLWGIYYTLEKKEEMEEYRALLENVEHADML